MNHPPIDIHRSVLACIHMLSSPHRSPPLALTTLDAQLMRDRLNDQVPLADPALDRVSEGPPLSATPKSTTPHVPSHADDKLLAQIAAEGCFPTKVGLPIPPDGTQPSAQQCAGVLPSVKEGGRPLRGLHSTSPKVRTIHGVSARGVERE